MLKYADQVNNLTDGLLPHDTTRHVFHSNHKQTLNFSLSTSRRRTGTTEVYLCLLLTLALDGGEEERELLTSRPDHFTPKKLNRVFPQSQCGRLDEEDYLLLLPEFEARTVQKAALSPHRLRYPDYAREAS